MGNIRQYVFHQICKVGNHGFFVAGLRYSLTDPASSPRMK